MYSALQNPLPCLDNVQSVLVHFYIFPKDDETKINDD